MLKGTFNNSTVRRALQRANSKVGRKQLTDYEAKLAHPTPYTMGIIQSVTGICVPDLYTRCELDYSRFFPCLCKPNLAKGYRKISVKLSHDYDWLDRAYVVAKGYKDQQSYIISLIDKDKTA